MAKKFQYTCYGLFRVFRMGSRRIIPSARGNAIRRARFAKSFGDHDGRGFIEAFDWESLYQATLCRLQGKSMLCVTGGAGSGKTMLLEAIALGPKRIIKAQPRVEIAYFFFNKSRNADLDNSAVVASSLVSQVMRQQPYLRQHLTQARQLVDDKEPNQARQFHTMAMALYSMIQDSKFAPTLFLIDRIDECYLDGMKDLLALISITPPSRNVQWLISANDTTELSRGMDAIGYDRNRFSYLHLDAEIFMKPTAEKYAAYMANTVIKNIQDEELRQKVEYELLMRSQGNFLWTNLACKILRSRKFRQNALDITLELPKGVEYLFQYAMRGIQSLPTDDRHNCIEVLSTVAAAFRPLDVSELEAIVTLPSDANLEFIIRNHCAPFFGIYNGRVFSMHQFAREFLLFEPGRRDVSYIHANITQRCLALISADSSKKQALTPSPAVHYATLNWLRHFSRVRVELSPETFLSVTKFVENYLLEWLDLLKPSTDLGWVLTQTRNMERILKERILKPYLHHVVTGCLAAIRSASWLIQHQLFGEDPNEANPKNNYLFLPESLRRKLNLKKPKWLELWPTVRESSISSLTLKGHTDVVQSCAYSFDGRWLASGSNDQTVRIWNSYNGQLQSVIANFDSVVRTVQFSRKGHLVTVEDRCVKIWKAVVGTLEKKFEGSDMGNGLFPFKCAAFSNDAKKLAISRGDMVTIWDVPSYRLCKEWKTDLDISCMKFSNDGRRLALGFFSYGVGPCGSLAIFNPDEGKQLCQMKAEEPLNLHDICYSPDSRWIAAALDSGKVLVWKADSNGPALRSFSGHDRSVRSISFSPESSRLASASDDKTLRIWDLDKPAGDNQGQVLYDGDVRCVSWSPDSYVASASYDKTVRIWDVDLDMKREEDEDAAKLPLAHKKPITMVKFSPNEKLLASGSSDGQVCLWDGNTGRRLRSLEGHDDKILSLFFSPDGRRLGSISPKCINIWDPTTGMLTNKFCGRFYESCGGAFSHNGQLVASTFDHCVLLWDLNEESHENRNIMKRNIGLFEYIYTIAFSADDKYLVAAGYAGVIWMWHLTAEGVVNEESNREPNGTYRTWKLGPSNTIDAVAVSPSGQQVASHSSKSIQIWDIESQTLLKQTLLKKPREGPIISLQLAPDNLDWVMTDKGSLCLEPAKDGIGLCPSSWSSWSLHPEWIRWKEQNIIYIPQNYRPSKDYWHGYRTGCVQGHRMAIGCESGEVLLFGFVNGAEPK